ncbi:MAG: NTP transferase domain-containing protein [Thermoguttaceae bacterium]
MSRTLKTLGVVDACFSTDRCRRLAARKLGGKPMLEWVVRRATDCQQLDGVMVVTRDTPENRFVSNLVPLDVPVYLGSEADALSCMAAALETYQAEAMVRICADCVFVDPTLIDRLVITAQAQADCDYVGYCSRDGRPAILSPVDVYGEWVRTSALRKAAQRATAQADRDVPTRYVYSHPEKFNVRSLPAPSQIDRDDVRLAVAIEEDWDHTVIIFEALGPEQLDWQRIAGLLDQHPALRQRMADLNRVHGKG